MRTTSCLAAALLSMLATAAAAADTCGNAEARQEVTATYEGARQKLRREGEPVKLQKEKVGHVLVARPAPTPADAEALRADLDQLARILQNSPGAACQEALRVRKKHGL